MPSISFYNDGINYRLKHKRKLNLWLIDLVEREGGLIDTVNVVLTTDGRLKGINKEFLNHDYYTDIITFQYEEGEVSGEIYISLDRVKENAKGMKLSFIDELHRVIVHGFLHMCGYKDKSKADKEQMRSREDFYLTLRQF